MDYDDELIKDITPDVLSVLVKKRFFEALDDQLCPPNLGQVRIPCQGTYEVSTATLVKAGFDEEEIGEILDVLASQGGCCDCEVLYNVAEESRLKSEYWRARAEGKTPPQAHSRQS